MLLVARRMFSHVTIKRPRTYVRLATDLTRVLRLLQFCQARQKIERKLTLRCHMYVCEYCETGAGCPKAGKLNSWDQSWINANPGLKFNPLFQFVYFCTSIYLETSKKKTPVHVDKIFEEIFPNGCTCCWENCFKFKVNLS